MKIVSRPVKSLLTEKSLSEGIPGVMVVVHSVVVASTEADQGHRATMLNRSDVTLACKNEFNA